MDSIAKVAPRPTSSAIEIDSPTGRKRLLARAAVTNPLSLVLGRLMISVCS